MLRLEPTEVKAIRARLGKTQAELAQIVGVHVRTVRDWEIKTGVRGATARLLIRLDEENGDGSS